MRFYANPCTPMVRDAMRRGLIGMVATPAQGNRVEPEYDWCADNGAFTDAYPGDGAFLDWLDTHAEHRSACRFVVVPDVPFDAAGTLARFDQLGPHIRALGYRVAVAAQNGQEHLPVPWDDLDALFLAGDTGWKIGPHAYRLTQQARARGKWVHMGRVNSLQRLRIAETFGCHSADGTYLTYGPDINLGRLLGWLDDLRVQPSVFRELWARAGQPTGDTDG